MKLVWRKCNRNKKKKSPNLSLLAQRVLITCIFINTIKEKEKKLFLIIILTSLLHLRVIYQTTQTVRSTDKEIRKIPQIYNYIHSLYYNRKITEIDCIIIIILFGEVNDLTSFCHFIRFVHHITFCECISVNSK